MARNNGATETAFQHFTFWLYQQSINTVVLHRAISERKETFCVSQPFKGHHWKGGRKKKEQLRPGLDADFHLRRHKVTEMRMFITWWLFVAARRHLSTCKTNRLSTGVKLKLTPRSIRQSACVELQSSSTLFGVDHFSSLKDKDLQYELYIYYCIGCVQRHGCLSIWTFNNIVSVSASHKFFFLAMFCTTTTTQWSLGCTAVLQHEGLGFSSLVSVWVPSGFSGLPHNEKHFSHNTFLLPPPNSVATFYIAARYIFLGS